MRQELWALHLSPMLGTLLVVRARESPASEDFGPPHAPWDCLCPGLAVAAGAGCHRGKTSFLIASGLGA